jgi:hypothetical protein
LKRLEKPASPSGSPQQQQQQSSDLFPFLSRARLLRVRLLLSRLGALQQEAEEEDEEEEERV